MAASQDKHTNQLNTDVIPLRKQLWLTLAAIPKLLRLVWQAAPKLLLLSLLLTIASALIPIGWLYINKLIIDEITDLFQDESKTYQVLIGLICARFLLTLFKDIIAEFRPYISQILNDTFSLHTSRKLIEKSIQLDLVHYESSQFHDALSRAQQSGSSYPVRALSNVTTILEKLIGLLGIVGLLFQFSPIMLGLLLLACLPSLKVGMAFSNKGFATMQKQTPNSRFAAYFQGLITRQEVAKEIRLYNLGDYFLTQWHRTRLAMQTEINQLAWQRSTVRFRASFLQNLGYYIAYILVILRTVQQQITLGDFVMYSGAFSQAQGLINSLVENISVTYESNLYVDQYLDFLSLKSTVVSPANPVSFPNSITQGIHFENVEFTYPEAHQATLQDINLTIAPEENIALVGVNGVGKTTLVKLLTRLYDPSQGRILIEGTSLTDFSLPELRQNIAVMFQDFVHYKLSIATNIGLGNINAIQDRDRIIAAAQAAGIHDWICTLPEGYDTPLGNLFPKGRQLSGGQWQKIGLARVFMSSAPILILDEPTAALDVIAEAELFERFRQLTRGRITLFTSHRFSTVRLADRIVVLERGRILEIGNHERLMTLNGVYAHMFQTQAKGYQH